jgi:hypothetical protein
MKELVMNYETIFGFFLWIFASVFIFLWVHRKGFPIK